MRENVAASGEVGNEQALEAALEGPRIQIIEVDGNYGVLVGAAWAGAPGAFSTRGQAEAWVYERLREGAL